MSETTRKGQDYPGNYLRALLWSAAYGADAQGLTAAQIAKEFEDVLEDIPETLHD